MTTLAVSYVGGGMGKQQWTTMTGKRLHCNGTAGKRNIPSHTTSAPSGFTVHHKLRKTKSSCNTATNRTNNESIDLPLFGAFFLMVSTKQHISYLLWHWQCFQGSWHFFSPHSLTWMLMRKGWPQKQAVPSSVSVCCMCLFVCNSAIGFVNCVYSSVNFLYLCCISLSITVLTVTPTHEIEYDYCT